MRIRTWLGSLAVSLLVVAAGPADAQVEPLQAQGRIACQITENGQPAAGTITVRRGTTDVASASCGEPVSVPPGSYVAVLRLDGALDRPEQTRPVEVRAGATESMSANFATAVLEVSIQADGRRAAGMARIMKNGRQIAMLGSGVSAHLSTGTYDVVVRYRTREQRFDGVTLAANERRVLDASF